MDIVLVESLCPPKLARSASQQLENSLLLPLCNISRLSPTLTATVTGTLSSSGSSLSPSATPHHLRSPFWKLLLACSGWSVEIIHTQTNTCVPRETEDSVARIVEILTEETNAGQSF